MTASTQPAIETIRQRALEALNDDAIMVPIVELTTLARDAISLLVRLSVVEGDLSRKDAALANAADTFAEMAVALRLLRHPAAAVSCDIAEAGTRAALAPAFPSEPDGGSSHD